MCPLNNLHLCNEQCPSHAWCLPCTTGRCIKTFTSAAALTLHICWANHHFDTTQENQCTPPPLPVSLNSQAELRDSSSPTLVHPFVLLDEALKDPNIAYQGLSLSTSASKSPHPSNLPSTPSHHSQAPSTSPGSPMECWCFESTMLISTWSPDWRWAGWANINDAQQPVWRVGTSWRR